MPDEEAIVTLLSAEPGTITSLWGVSPHSVVHLAYDELIVRQREMVRNGCKHIVLLADFHAMMSHGLSLAQATARVHYWQHYLESCCDLSARFVCGSEFQTHTEYVEQLFALVNTTKVSSVKDTLTSAKRQDVGTEASMVSSYLYAIMQCLDASHLKADIIFGEKAQQKIYKLIPAFPRDSDFFSPIGNHANPYTGPRGILYAPTGHDIQGKPLAESRSGTRICIHETRASLEKKIAKMYAPPANQPLAEGRVNALLEYFRYSVFPWRSNAVTILAEDGELLEFQDYNSLVTAYQSERIHPAECKKCLTDALFERISEAQRTLGIALVKWVNIEKAIGLS